VGQPNRASSLPRISIAGYEQPTPVTALGTTQLEQAFNPDIGNIIQAGIRFNISVYP
jgi:hypothetical protein